ncbi:UDP-N-acetylmuramoyl-L-alanine--D-glutamate ligase [Candidatus Dojkabacteria bacterium]|uniref:UDP-N-acetylmuramoyl-L-alanine--D-glutamate ligase n=1 Tax=Candidatus Dojkabacteria bacterium TaxID=2099670 RepID=A0A3M0Z2W7_9BACT|nr:MAG: UDP-N-acetylmuramoyl-L-alanine--D-glutamate ligase [Candidatus Dojkabacteria bacterium]
MEATYEDFKSNLKNLKVLVWGIGIAGGGVNVAKFFADNGSSVIAIDAKDRDNLKESIEELEKYDNIKIHLGDHKEEDFIWADLIIKNPAVPPNNCFLTFCKEKNKRVETEISLFMKYAKGYKIGITGTRGKSTTTALLTKVLQDNVKGREVITGGNNKISLLQQIEKVHKDDLVVMEISSFMCFSLRQVHVSPNLSIITNIYPDHLDWHPDMQHYITSKGALLEFQNEEDFAILNVNNRLVRLNYVSLGKGKKVLVDSERVEVIRKKICSDGKIINEELEGEHNLENITLVWEAATLLGISESELIESIRSYKGLEFRQQKIDQKGNVVFINDSCSTMPEATIVCLERFRNKGDIHLIVGGTEKNFLENSICELIDKFQLVKTVHFLEGSLYSRILDILSVRQDKNLVEESYKKKFFGPYNNMFDAVMSAYSQASALGGYVILSPAAASFNLFKNSFDRGKIFNDVVKSIIN